MRILVITTFYAPDLGAAAALYTMLCEDLVELGHQVSVISTVPHYPTGRVVPEYPRRLVHTESRNGVKVIRAWVPSGDRGRLFHRLLSFLAYQVIATLVGIGQKYDAVIAANPALEVFLPFLCLAVMRNKPAIFSVHDLYPEVGVKLGIFRHGPVIHAVGAMEDLCLKRAVYVRALSDGFKESLIRRGVPAEKVVTIWDWLDTDFVRPYPRQNELSAQWGVDPYFVVQYAGNIGLSQGLEHVLEVAALLSDHADLRFLFVGDGAGKNSLVEEAAKRRLSNVEFVPFQRREVLPAVLGTADVSLISLKHGMSSDSVPSKFYSILASARPVIAAVDADSDTAKLVTRASCGFRVNPEDPQALAEAVRVLYRDAALRRRMGGNGRRYVVEHHGRASAASAFDRLVRNLSTNGQYV